MIKKIVLILISIYILSCNENNNIINEIEPNDTIEYAQFIESDINLRGSFSDDDIDYYYIKPTNGFIMNFNLSVNNDSNILLEFISKENSNSIFVFESKNIKNYSRKIGLDNILLNESEYLLKLYSDGSADYSMSLMFSREYNYKNENEYNDNIYIADGIDYPNQKIIGHFINEGFSIDESISPYLQNKKVLDIDFFKIQNETDINTSINIITQYKEDIEILLFDENYNFLRKSTKKIENLSFNKDSEYYIALVFYGDKYLLDQYILYYNFN